MSKHATCGTSGSHALTCAITHDYEQFVAQELPGRASPAYPPTVRLANIVLSGTREDATADLAVQAGEWFARTLAPLGPGVLETIGPAPCAVDRIKDRWRWHLLIKSPSEKELTAVATYLVMRFPVPARHGLRLSVDRDPVTLL